MANCARCKVEVPKPECCWYCNADLCVECWEALGHCGHLEAEAINEAGRRATPEARRAMARALSRTVDAGKAVR